MLHFSAGGVGASGGGVSGGGVEPWFRVYEAATAMLRCRHGVSVGITPETALPSVLPEPQHVAAFLQHLREEQGLDDRVWHGLGLLFDITGEAASFTPTHRLKPGVHVRDDRVTELGGNRIRCALPDGAFPELHVDCPIEDVVRFVSSVGFLYRLAWACALRDDCIARRRASVPADSAELVPA